MRQEAKSIIDGVEVDSRTVMYIDLERMTLLSREEAIESIDQVRGICVASMPQRLKKINKTTKSNEKVTTFWKVGRG